MLKRSCSSCAIAALAIAAHLYAADSLTVTTAQGKVEGKIWQDGKVHAFLGLPYAAPPTGPLRWKAPQQPAAWTGLRNATSFSSRCEQWPIWKDYIFLDPGPSEDCLYLNVFVPASANAGSRLPVMFWIHGGGYTAGAGSEPRYADTTLPLRGVIVVTINYRLGVFGFLAAEDLAKENGGAAGNYGLMDMVAALRWTQANIAEFGGDPNNITIVGESAGSFAVSTLMAAPAARGLFQKAIGESGAAFSNVLATPPLATREQRDQQWVASLGVHNLAELRALPAETVLEAARKQMVGWFSPVIDGQFLTEGVPETYAAGKQAHVPLLAGWNHDERAGTLSNGMTAEKWKAFAAEHFGNHAQEFLDAFPGTTDAEAVRSADAYTTAMFIAFGTWQWIEADAKTGHAPVYRYRFDLPAPPSEMHPEGKYAWHSDELEYVFGTLDERRGSTWRPEDRALSEQMMRYWTNFARTGDPNGPPSGLALPHWPRFDTERQILVLHRNVTAGPDSTRPQYEFLQANPPRMP
jgi:para-nitrobenzyl esterase